MSTNGLAWGSCLMLVASAAIAQPGLNLLGQTAEPAGSAAKEWGIACSWTAREKHYRNLNVGECSVTKSAHLPSQTDHWVELGKSWNYCAGWMRNAGVQGW